MAQESLQKLRELMKNNRFCMLTTNSPQRLMRSRPMTLQQTEFDGDLWFVTNRHSDVKSDIDGDARVNVSFSDGSASFVSIAGNARFVEDDAKKKELWSDMLKTYFPGGVEDPNLLLMKVEVLNAEYWDTPGGKVMQLIEMVKMMTTHEHPKGEHEEIDLRSAR